MNIGELLSLRGAELSAVVSMVDATVGVGAGDVLLAVGSIVEGLGNSKSDLDLLFISPRGESTLPSGDQVTLLVGRCLIDVRILRLAKLQELLARFKTWAQLPWNIIHPVEFTLDERILLHRLLHAQVLHKGKKSRIMSQLPPVADLARLKLQVARHLSRTIQVDMVGYREVGDYRSLVFASQELLGHAVDALLAGCERTNPIIKWRSRLLDSVPSDWEGSLVIRPTGLTAREQVWRLHRAPERPNRERALEHAFRITTLARAVFMWSELGLANGSARSVAKQKPTIWPQIERKSNDSPLPYLDFDVDFFLEEGRVTIARLNEFDRVLKMSRREFALALLFDGATTAREAEITIYGDGRSKRRTSAIERLASRLAVARFSISPNSGRSKDSQIDSSKRARKKRP